MYCLPMAGFARGLLLVLIMTGGSRVAAQTTSDIYDKIAELHDSLVAWRAKLPIANTPADCVSEEELSNLLERYPSEIRRHKTGVDTVLIQLPSYESIIDGNVFFSLPRGNCVSGFDPKWIPCAAAGSWVSDYPEGQSDTATILRSLVNSRLSIYSSLSFPPSFWPMIDLGSSSTSLLIHGRDIVAINYDDNGDFIGALRILCQNAWVYAAVSRVAMESNDVELKVNLLITGPKALRNHYVEVVERFNYGDKDIRSVSVEANYYPFIPINNVKALFGDSAMSYDGEKMRIELNRGGASED